MIKKEIYKYEKPLCICKNLEAKDRLFITKKDVSLLGITNNSVVLFRFSHMKHKSFARKITASPYNYSTYLSKYSIRLGRKIIEDANLKLGSKINLEIIQKKDFMGEKENNIAKIIKDKVNVVSLLDKNCVYFERPNNWLTIYSYPRKDFTIPKYIKIDSNLCWCIGFYLAEGSRKRSPFGISNSDLILIKKFKDIIEEKIEINPTIWKIENSRNKSLNQKFVEQNIVKNLNVNGKNIKFYIKKEKINGINGVTKLEIANVIFFRIFNILIKDLSVHNFISNKKKRILGFLRGVEAGDGFISCANKDKKRKNFMFGIEMKDKKLIDLLENYFNSLYLPLKRGERERNGKKYYRIYYQDCRVIRNLILDNHFLEHKKNRKRLIEGYSNKKFGKIDYMYFNIIKKGKSTHHQIRDHFNYSQAGAYTKLILMMEGGLLNREKINKRYNYSLTKKGEYLYKCLSMNIDKNG